MNLQQVPSLNYKPALNNIGASLAQWQRHLLSPLGKIIVLKSFIMSKLNYLFLCILDPSKNFIKTFLIKLEIPSAWIINGGGGGGGGGGA